MQRVLLVRPNFRIGNTLTSTQLVLALRERFPGAQLDCLVADTTASLLAHLPINRIYTVSRRFVTHPWSFIALFIQLRRARYDVAVAGGMGSFSGRLYTYLAGIRYRIGSWESPDPFLNVHLRIPRRNHVYEDAVYFAQALGVSCPNRPVYEVSPDERATARSILDTLDLIEAGAVHPFIALFMGGHREKRWPAEYWLELATALGQAGARVVVFLGPDELWLEARVRQELPSTIQVIPTRPLRVFAALLAEAKLIVTPDSGPMHLAAALALPTISLLQTETSLRYCPMGANDKTLLRPTVSEVVTAIVAHPVWSQASLGSRIIVAGET